jgi:hypothetical protein
MGKMRNSYKILVEKCEEKRQIGRSRRIILKWFLTN